MADAENPRTVPSGDAGPAPRRPLQVIDSTTLFGQSSELVIRHNGRDYRLRLTRLGKLILTA